MKILSMTPSRGLLPLALLAIAWPAAAATPQEQPALTATTLATGLARAPAQEAVVFEHADPQFQVDPAPKRIVGDANLLFRATRTLTRLCVDLDRPSQLQHERGAGK